MTQPFELLSKVFKVLVWFLISRSLPLSLSLLFNRPKSCPQRRRMRAFKLYKEMVLVDRGEDDEPGASGSGLLLDRQSSVARFGGGLQSDA